MSTAIQIDATIALPIAHLVQGAQSFDRPVPMVATRAAPQPTVSVVTAQLTTTTESTVVLVLMEQVQDVTNAIKEVGGQRIAPATKPASQEDVLGLATTVHPGSIGKPIHIAASLAITRVELASAVTIIHLGQELDG